MSTAELLIILELGLIYGIVAMGIYFTFRIIDFPDLTCDGSFVTGSAVCAMAIKSGFSPIVSLCFGVLAGGMCGLVTGLLYAHGKLSNLLSGILTAFMLYSINLRVMKGIPNISLPSDMSGIDCYGSLCVIAAVVWMLCSFTLTTDFGLGLRCIGSNPILGRIQGISVSGYTIVALMLSNALIGMGGALFCQHQGFCDISQGLGTVVIGFASIIIGEKILPYRSMWIRLGSCIVGSILYRFVIALSLHSSWLGLRSSDMNLITGVILISIMIASSIRRSRSC